MAGHEDAKARRKSILYVSCLRAFVAIQAAVAIGCSQAAGPQVDLHPIAKQNVLLITIDTLRADALGSYGGPASTPALDRLASEGVRFDFAHAHAVVTLPSHASILTGRYPFEHGLRDNSGYRLPAGFRTAATVLKQGGYATAAFVAGFPLHSRFGLNQGFDVYDDRFGDTRAPADFDMPERPASAVVPLARAWIAEQSGGTGRTGGMGGTASPQPRVPSPDGPWFVWLHLFDPHTPYRPPPPFDATYANRPYYGEVAAVDAALAPLLDDLRSSPRPTLVIVTADHGEALGDHGEQSHGLFAYESTLRVPLIVAEVNPPDGPGFGAREGGPRDSRHAGPAGEVSVVAARHVDILPTILDAVGQPLPSELPGRSLLPAAERAARTPRPSYFEAMSGMLNRGWAPLSGIVLDREKFIDLPIPERYDLATDPAEATNLAGRTPAQDRTLAASLAAFKAPAPGQRMVESPDAAARLRSLGYLSGSAPAKSRYTTEDDPKHLVELDRTIHDAVAAFGAGRSADAVRLYQGVIERRPDMAIAYRHLAFVEARRGNMAAAIEVLQQAIAKGVTDIRLIAQLGETLVDAGRLAQGIQLLEPLVRQPNVDPQVLNALGIAYATARRHDDARRVFERVLTVDPGSPVPLENLGMLAVERGDLTTARTRFEEAIAVDPRSSRAYAGVGLVALRQGSRAAAIEAWTRAVQLEPRNFDALYNLAVTLAREDRAAARPYLEQFLKTAPPARYAKDRAEVARLLNR
jgi:arylsulfatase A-like enzyme/Tfp pilus assembly protein PilF